MIRGLHDGLYNTNSTDAGELVNDYRVKVRDSDNSNVHGIKSLIKSLMKLGNYSHDALVESKNASGKWVVSGGTLLVLTLTKINPTSLHKPYGLRTYL